MWPSIKSQLIKSPISKFSIAMDSTMRAIFFRLGLFVAVRPAKVIIASLVFFAFTLVGMLRFSIETRLEKLWIPVGSMVDYQHRWVNANFGRTFRSNGIVFVARNSSEGIRTKKTLFQILNIVEKGFTVTADPLINKGESNATITFEERCIRTSDENGNIMCMTMSAFNLFYNVTQAVFHKDGKVNFFATVRKTIERLSESQIESTLKYSSTTFDNSSFIRDELYPANKQSKSYPVFLYAQLIENHAVDKDGTVVDEEAEELEKRWTDFLLDRSNFNEPEDVDWFVSSEHAINESASKTIRGDLPLVAIGIALLTLYVVFFLGDWHAIRSHRMLGCAALWTCQLAIGTCFGLSSALGMFFGPVHQLLLLLLFGIGADDCFHITRAADDIFQRADMKDRSVETRIALAMSQAGTTITVTSFTNIFVFLLSAITKLPALRYFGVWAAIGIFFAWVYAITFFTALLTFDFRRIEANRLDCLPHLKPRKNAEVLNWFNQTPGAFSRFFEHYVGPFITGNIARLIIMIIFLTGFGACMYGATQLDLNFRLAYYFSSGTSQRDFQDIIDKYFRLGDSTHVYIRGKSLKSVADQDRFLRLCHPETGLIVTNEWIQNDSVTCWYDSMRKHNPPIDSNFYKPDEFISYVKEFIKTGNPGNRFSSDIVFNENNTEIIATRFAAKYEYRETNNNEIIALESLRRASNFDIDDVADLGDGFGADENGKWPAAFPYSILDIYTEQQASLRQEIGLSLGTACLAVAIVCFIMIGHPLVAAISVIIVGMIIVDLLGLTYYSGINLNSLSVCTLVLCTGISVDFVVHITKAFLEHVGTRTDRAIKCLAQMGPPVFYAGFSTLLSVLVLGLSSSYVFRVVFLGFTSLIILSFLHSFVLGPVILSLIGPPGLFESEEEKENAVRTVEKRFVTERNSLGATTIADLESTKSSTCHVSDSVVESDGHSSQSIGNGTEKD